VSSRREPLGDAYPGGFSFSSAPAPPENRGDDLSATAAALKIDCPIPAEPKDRAAREAALLEALDERILVLDGATGTALQGVELTAADFGGPELEGCNENLCATRPDVVASVHHKYLAAGCDIVETNSFGSTPLVLAEYDLADKAFELSSASARIAREVCVLYDTPGRPRFVCGAMGPTTKALSVTGGVTFDDLAEHFRVQALGLMDGGADYLLLETCQDTRNIKAGLIGLENAFRDAGWRLPVAVSVTIEATGTMLAGQDAEALAVSLLHADLLYVGINCATGPELMRDHVRTLSEICRTRVACVPNAGLPDEDGHYHEGPAEFERVFGSFVGAGWLNLVGGCCGSHDGHITALAALTRGRRPRPAPHHQRALVSGLEAVELTADNRPLLVGERTNVLGSRKFKELIAAGEHEKAAEIGRAQVRGGAQVLDICLQDPDRDEMADVEAFLDRLVRVAKAPLMIDSTDAEVMERALTYCQGKAILNSINLEDGLERFHKVVPLARRFGSALVVGCIDETGMAVSVERKLEVARRSFDILVNDMGVAPEDIWWDALVFPCGTGDAAYVGSAGLTVEGVRAIKRDFPLTKTILGVSNVSFGLPAAGREVVNSVFLYHCTQAGLDAAIVNTERLARYAEISEEERKLAEALLFVAPGDLATADQAVAALTDFYRGKKTRDVKPRRDLPLEERLARAIVEGSKEGLEDDLVLALQDPRWPKPLDLINGPLMEGMREVGRLFNGNQLIVAEVLQSAEVMKAAVSYLEPLMERAEGATRGTVLLATVKGDVHDIGKNLVDIVLSNNGFRVVNLGIKVPSEQLVQAAREHRPDIIGLSGLLVKSAQQMVLTAGDLRSAGIEVPLLVGGAALTRRFTHRKIAPSYGSFCTYAKDAMHGLRLVEEILDPAERARLEEEVAALRAKDEEAGEADAPAFVPSAPRQEVIRRDVPVPAPPDLERHVATFDLDDVWGELNLQMLFGKHLGLKGPVARLKEQGDEKLARLEELLVILKAAARDGGMFARGVWQFFPARAEGERLDLLDPSRRDVVASWTLPRQQGGGLSLPDYVLDGDHVGLFVTGIDGPVREWVERWKADGEYLKSHGFAALALETAEASAEWLHKKMRADWGFPDGGEVGLNERLQARYRGKRYSFGYPACPDLAGQRELFKALRPEEIGVQLTEGDMMDPEASVSALVFHHPDARYFGV
jgi:5-methyltetrahydrofolate--homocysteine methyltransferase